MAKSCKNFMIVIKYLFLLLLGGSIYYSIELLYRGYSHLSMFLVGGICFILIGALNELFQWPMSIWKQILIGDAIVLVVEFITGCIVNLWLGLGVWDYSNLPFNLLGQISLPFAILWLPIVWLAIVIDDYARYIIFREEKPRYNYRWK